MERKHTTRRRNRHHNDVETISGHACVQFVTDGGGGPGALAVTTSSFGSSLLAISDLYRLYRFTKLELSFSSTPTSAGSSRQNDAGVIVCYTSGIPGTAPASFGQICEFDNVSIAYPLQAVQSHLRLGRKDMEGIANWYETQGSAGDPLLDTQGNLYATLFGSNGAAAVASNTITMLATYTVEFCERLPAAVSLDRMAKLKPATDYVSIGPPSPTRSVRGHPVRSRR